jgi:predicted permease
MKFWNRFRRQSRDEDLADEIQAHLAMAAQDRIDRGEFPEEAEKSAHRELGNELLIREVTRDMWGRNLFETCVQDLRYAFRQMRRSPGFTAIAVLTLALGLGATTAMFSIVNGVLLRPLNFREPGRLYLARTLPPARANIAGEFPVNARHFHEWRQHCRSCEDVSLVRFDQVTMVGAGEPVELPTYTVSYNFFRSLGVHPAIGRDFLPEEELPGRAGEVILTDALWRSRFAADQSIVGRAIQINGESWTVIGVMPRDLHLPKGEEWGSHFGPEAAPLIFKPLGMDVSTARGAGNLNYLGVVRLKAGVSREQGMAEVNALLDDFVREYNLTTTITLIPLEQQVTRHVRSPLWLLLGAVAAVLLIACVNVGNLMLVRTAGRYREAGVRMALGASRARLFRLILSESLVLVSIGCALGLALAYGAITWFAGNAPISLPRLDEIDLDWRVLAFAAIAGAFSTILCGLVPAWRLSRTDPQESIKAGAGASESGGKLRLREILVSVEVALSTVLLIVGALLMSSFIRVMHVETGVDVAHIVTQDVSFLNPKYRGGAHVPFLDNLLRKLAEVPGVDSVAAVNQLPLIGEDWISELEDPDQPAHPADTGALANSRFVTPDYFKTMGIPLKQGRFLDETDRVFTDAERNPDASEHHRLHAVVSERAAQFLWPDQNPIGRHVVGIGRAAQGHGNDGPALEVVGVVGEVRAAELERTTPTMMIYENYARIKPTGMSIVLRTHADPAPLISALHGILSAADPEMAIEPAKTMEQILDDSVASRRFQMYLTVTFAVAALVLASLGIYGVISFAVARRTPEIGIRIALGARRKTHGDGFPAGNASRSRGAGGRPGQCGIARPLSRQLSLWSRTGRSSHDLDRLDSTAGCSDGRLLDSRAPRDQNRSAARHPLRLVNF